MEKVSNTSYYVLGVLGSEAGITTGTDGFNGAACGTLSPLTHVGDPKDPKPPKPLVNEGRWGMAKMGVRGRGWLTAQS